MILEGIVTTVSHAGDLNVAPMGPRVPSPPETMRGFVLRPFQTATTFKNLAAHGEGVFHTTDDVLLLARAAIGRLEPAPPARPAAAVRGFVLTDACRFWEFRVARLDDRDDRATIDVEVVAAGRQRDFFGFNRAKHAVLEAAILATRTAILPAAEIRAEYDRLGVIVGKTGGEQERQAFDLLLDFVTAAGRGADA